MAPALSPGPLMGELGFAILHQKVHLDLDLASRRLHGETEILLNPLSADSHIVQLRCRQCTLLKITINGRVTTDYRYNDPYARARLEWRAGVRQYHMLQERLINAVHETPEDELIIYLPAGVRPQTTHDRAQFAPITLHIRYEISRIRDGLQVVGLEDGDQRYPHAFSLNSSYRGSWCPLFPCSDDLAARHTWDMSFRCAKTLRDAMPKDACQACSVEDQAREMLVLCTGEMTNEIDDADDLARKTTSFVCSNPIAARHLAFAVGPFERVDLSRFRQTSSENRMGSRAVQLHAFCLPGRVDAVINACFPLAKAMDFLSLTYGAYPFANYKLCFVDDAPEDMLPTGWLSICSNRLPFPADVLDPIYAVTRQLVYTLAFQWIGVDIVPRLSEDSWVTVGVAYYITDIFMRSLCGNNEYRFNQKMAASLTVDLDVGRASLAQMGVYANVEPSEARLLSLKAPLVMFILDQRLQKAGHLGLVRIISKMFLNARVGDIPENAVDAPYFQRICEKTGHEKLGPFWDQWVYGSGCPKFRIAQRYNKKKLAIEISVQQVQDKVVPNQELTSHTFMRAVRDEMQDYPTGTVQPCFTGPMTIRVHEANGAPYEHIIEIREAFQKEDIPYHTKYKRRGKKAKNKKAGAEAADGVDEAPLYSLGDVLQSEEEVKQWRLVELEQTEEDSLGQESYEWLRMDVNFEWICKIQLQMPGPMWVSQLQQDKDVVAQYESIQYMSAQKPNAVISTILLRTLLDSRYFHGIRTAAAQGMAIMAAEDADWIGLVHLEKAFQQMFCYEDSTVTRPNDFSDRAAYLVECAIIKAVGQVRDAGKHAPLRTRKWLYEKLRFNDNSSNQCSLLVLTKQYSDAYYVAELMRALSCALASRAPPRPHDDVIMDDDDHDDFEFHSACLEEIDRQRRMDEWTPSHHNVVSRCALKSQKLLTQAGVVALKPVYYLQYTSDDTNDQLRIDAFDTLLSLGLARQDPILQWFLLVLATESSPYVRRNLLRILGETLGAFAIGDFSEDIRTAATQQGDLVIEAEASTEVRRAIFIRKQSVVGALDALKAEIGINPTLEAGLWQAITSSSVSLSEQWQLLDLCDKLYVPENKMLLVLRLPRYWKCQRVGKGQVVFSQTDRIRTKQLPRKPLKIKLHTGTPATSAYPFLKREALPTPKTARPLFKAPKLPSTPGPSTPPLSCLESPETSKPKLKIKLKLKGSGQTNNNV